MHDACMAGLLAGIIYELCARAKNSSWRPSSMSSDEDTVKFATNIIEKSCRFGLLDRGKQFNALSNFKISIISEVRAGEYSGFTCTVTLYSGEELG